MKQHDFVLFVERNKMIKNCKGCEEEFMAALDYQEQGLHFATYLDKEFWKMVDDKGKIVIW